MKRYLCILFTLAIIISLWGCTKTDDLATRSEENYLSLGENFTDVKIIDDESALEAVNSISAQLGLANANEELKVTNSTSVGGTTYYRMQQYYQGIPVYGRTVALSSNGSGNATALTSNIIGRPYDASIEPAITEAEALAKLSDYYQEINSSQLFDQVIIDLNDIKPQLAYRFIVSGVYDDEVVHEECFVSAVNGKLLFTNSLVNQEDYNYQTNDNLYTLYDEGRNIVILNSNRNYADLDAKYSAGSLTAFACASGFPDNSIIPSPLPEYIHFNVLSPLTYVTSATTEWDRDAETLMQHLETTYDFYYQFLSRKGFDNNNGFLAAAYNDNARSIEGVGHNALSFNCPSIPYSLLVFGYHIDLSCIETIAHEYTHSVESHISDMANQGESGALKEAYSDIFAELLEDYSNDGVLNNNCSWEYSYLRNIADPSKTKNPSEYQGRYWGNTSKRTDNGYVHKNSTVISHAAYLMSQGINGTVSKQIDNTSLAKLWYRSLFLLQADATFSQCADAVATVASQMRLSGELTSSQCVCVREAFTKVGISSELFGHRVVNQNAKLNVVSGSTNENYDNYHLVIINEKNGKTVVEKDINNANPYTLGLKPGNYTICVTDNSTTDNKSDKALITNITVVNRTEEDPNSTVYIFTDFGQVNYNAEYLNIIHQLENTYGYRLDGNIFANSLNFASLIDFNKDGIDELLVEYTDNSVQASESQRGYTAFRYEIWGVVDNQVTCVDQGTALCNGGSDLLIQTAHFKNKVCFVTGVAGYGTFLEYRAFNGISFETIFSYSEIADTPGGTVNGISVSEQKLTSAKEEFFTGLIEHKVESPDNKFVQSVTETKIALGENINYSFQNARYYEKFREVQDAHIWTEFSSISVFFFDVNHDGIEEMFIELNDGSEPTRQTKVYTYEDNECIYVGDFSAWHTRYYIDSTQLIACQISSPESLKMVFSLADNKLSYEHIFVDTEAWITESQDMPSPEMLNFSGLENKLAQNAY